MERKVDNRESHISIRASFGYISNRHIFGITGRVSHRIVIPVCSYSIAFLASRLYADHSLP
jgi:hypothetical protein